MALSVNLRYQMLTGGLMDSAQSPIVSVIAQVQMLKSGQIDGAHSDKWPNAWSTFSQFFSDSGGVMLTSGFMDIGHALSCAGVVTRKSQ